MQARISLLDVTINVDEPENGLEAMAQVITCEEIIGWRSRDGVGPDRGLLRIILYISDDHFHYAGEGQVSMSLLPLAMRRIRISVHGHVAGVLLL